MEHTRLLSRVQSVPGVERRNEPVAWGALTGQVNDPWRNRNVEDPPWFATATGAGKFAAGADEADASVR